MIGKVSFSLFLYPHHCFGDTDINTTPASPICSPFFSHHYHHPHHRHLDSNRKFVEAARQYYEISNTNSNNVPYDDKIELLGKAASCAVLGKAGPQRSRILGLIYKDERLKDLSLLPVYASHKSVLSKMYTERLLFTDELKAFENSLKQHQKADTAEGYTYVEKAVIEHNMLAASRIYDNITFRELASLLRLSTEEAERVAAKMITEKRLKGSIDQTLGLLKFISEHDTPLLSWNDRIKDLSVLVTDTVEEVTSVYPELAP